MQSFTSARGSIFSARSPQILLIGERKVKGYNQSVLGPADAAEKAGIEIMDRATELKELPLATAFEKWLEEKALRNRDTTINCYRDYLKPVATFMEIQTGVRTLTDIHIGHFLEYQRRHKNRYHPASVNHHLNTLAQILRRAGLWAPIREHYRPLPLPEVDPPKVMSESEEDAFFQFASKNPGWELAYWVASVTNNTTASGKELRMLQRGSIHRDHDPPYFHVPKNMKTPQRQRNIPMNERADEMMRRILLKAAERGSTRDEHYVFPKRVKRGLFDPNQPATESWLRAQWKKLVDAAVDAKVISFRIKPHNLRHQAITKLLDYGVPIETVRQIAGHGVDSLVTRHYHHGRMEVMARATDLIDPDKKHPQAVPQPSKRRNGDGA